MAKVGNTLKPSIPEVVARFAAYLEKNPEWGSLHIVLDEGNVHDDNVRFCLEWSRKNGDMEGLALAEALLSMSKTQRLKLPSYALEYLRCAWSKHRDTCVTCSTAKAGCPAGIYLRDRAISAGGRSIRAESEAGSPRRC